MTSSNIHQALRAVGVSVNEPTGDDVLNVARKHLGENYVFGARAPMSNSQYKGPWDCAEFVSWCVFQASGTLYGVRPNDDPVQADAFTGFWGDDAESLGIIIDVNEAAATPGACLLRLPATGRIGHIAFSDGKGGTIEAYSSKEGVIEHTAHARRWDIGVLVPSIRYFTNDEPISLELPATRPLRLTSPMTRGPRVKELQQKLADLGFNVGDVDGIFGSQTADAVQAFQLSQGLTADGEAGRETLEAIGLA